ncbi:Hsp20/alpha crystallin family protein [Candidatus Nomurabacteria bacterium]|nr:Hsp20/alpha crystallin family protein [Candidatus Nomurabacteria bacterium]
MSLIPWSPFLDTFESLENTNFLPAIDVYEDHDQVVVEASLAGISPEDVNISVKDDVFTLEGTRRETSEIDEKNYYRKEVRTGSFHRSVILPDSVQADKAEAHFENGLLKVRLPKETQEKSKNIEIKIKK